MRDVWRFSCQTWVVSNHEFGLELTPSDAVLPPSLSPLNLHLCFSTPISVSLPCPSLPSSCLYLGRSLVRSPVSLQGPLKDTQIWTDLCSTGTAQREMVSVSYVIIQLQSQVKPLSHLHAYENAYLRVFHSERSISNIPRCPPQTLTQTVNCQWMSTAPPTPPPTPPTARTTT